jgi:hypothetical protein
MLNMKLVKKKSSDALPKDTEVEDGVLEIRSGVTWNKKQVKAHNWVMYQLSQDLIAGDSKEILENAVDTNIVGG